MSQQDYSYRNVNKNDLATIHKWLSLPHIAEWIHGDGLQSTLSGLERCVNGEDPINRYWIASFDKEDFALLIAGPIDKLEPNYSSVEFKGNKAVSLDIFIGNKKYLGKGIASCLIAEFLLTQFPLATDFVIDPEKSNHKAVHVYKKTGFTVTGEFIAVWHPVPHLMMHTDRKKLQSLQFQNEPWPQVEQKLAATLIAEQFPEYASMPIKPVSVSGWDNRSFRLGLDLMIRLPSSPAYSAQVEKEQQWLPKLLHHVSFSIPTPVELGAPCKKYPSSWSIYKWIEGEALSSVQAINKTQIATDLAGFLKELRLAPAAFGPKAGKHSFFRGGELNLYSAQTIDAIDKLSGKIDKKQALEIWKAALSSSWGEEPVWVHGDVSPGNLLVKDGSLSAMIDFGQLNVGDPACDFAIAWTYFDRKSRSVFKENSNIDEDTWMRGCGWALWKAAIMAAGMGNSNPVELQQCWNTLEQILTYTDTNEEG